MAFWGESMDASSADPKRKFRFKVLFGGGTGDPSSQNQVIWWAKSVTKPKMTVDPTEHKFMGHTFKYPGSVKWENVSLILVDPVSPDAAKQTLKIMREAGYIFPEEGYADTSNAAAFNTINKGKAVAAVGLFTIVQMDAEGKAVETWTLHNPFFTSVQFSDLAYDGDDLSDITIDITYDWAKLKTGDSYEFKFPSGN
jgi:hypothetical protein